VGNFVAVIGRHRKLPDLQAGYYELDDDLGIEMKVVGIAIEWNTRKRRGRIDTIARVEFAELGSQEFVFDPGQDLVSDKLVKRHSALQRRTAGLHARPEYRVGVTGP